MRLLALTRRYNAIFRRGKQPSSSESHRDSISSGPQAVWESLPCDREPPTFPEPAESVARNRLCEYCASICIEVGLQKNGGRHAPNLARVKQNAKFCPLCKWLQDMEWYAHKDNGWPTAPPEESCRLFYYIRVFEGDEGATTHLRFTSSSGLETDAMDVYTFEGDVAKRSFKVPSKKRLTSTASRQSIEAAAGWLRLCTTEHDCGRLELPLPNAVGWSSFKAEDLSTIDSRQDLSGRPIGSGSEPSSARTNRSRPASPHREFGQDTDLVLPGRLVDLRQFSVSDTNKTARLIDTADLEVGDRKKDGFYSTLSYCWGGEQFYKVTETNVDSARAGLPYDDLPPTFRDAFQITKSLGVDFIWIDALCILQGHREDWNRESSKMSYIYSRAAFCIAADSSYGASGGCFNTTGRTGQREVEDTVTIKACPSEGVESTLLVYKTARGRYQPTAVQDAPISCRGWTYQERLLSARILHYTSEQLFWECRKRYLAEDGTVSWLYSGPGPPTTISSRARYIKKSSWSAIQNWCKEEIEDFTARKLTNPGDKLPALAGIARLYHGSIPSPYVAGIWLYQLGCGLGWHLTTPDTTTQTRKTRTNSFSWISVEGAVQNFGEPMSKWEDFPLTIKACEVHLENERDPFGAVGPCSLTLAVLLKSAQLDDRQYRHRHPPRKVVTAEFPGSGVVEMGWALMDTEEQHREIWCFPIADTVKGIEAVLVCPVSPHIEGMPRYRRLGLLRIPQRHHKTDDGALWLGCGQCQASNLSQGGNEYGRGLQNWFKGCQTETIILV
ncbi:heterokaryon incompatibility protein-domain-containing protein [Immersiella caudata]|uniref:Heterokaryon incompatibility protein-domain-containing protein n=1 Tax=Immersiella caudata TaxID=314043 RepID=A0AA39WYV0_9PEZI|nr:heterokaryon incompatibility protein-domain-containing protein [Immersiella caudata]